MCVWPALQGAGRVRAQGTALPPSRALHRVGYTQILRHFTKGGVCLCHSPSLYHRVVDIAHSLAKISRSLVHNLSAQTAVASRALSFIARGVGASFSPQIPEPCHPFVFFLRPPSSRPRRPPTPYSGPRRRHNSRFYQKSSRGARKGRCLGGKPRQLLITVTSPGAPLAGAPSVDVAPGAG
jgi:hypothetical protein